jgi:CHAD domain-containing protein
MRVTARRLAAALATFGPLWDTAHGVDPAGTRARLVWLGSVLGEARDLEVMRARLGTVAGHDAPTQAGLTRLDEHLAERQRTAVAAIAATFESDDYPECLALVQSLLLPAAFTDAASQPAARVLRPLVRRDWRRVQRRAREARGAEGHERDVRLHELRKSARRLRYSAEAVAPVFGRDAEVLAREAKAVQDVLGDHQDSVVSAGVLGALASTDDADAHSAAYASLVAVEGRYRAQTEEQFAVAWERLADRRIRAWLRRGQTRRAG